MGDPGWNFVRLAGVLLYSRPDPTSDGAEAELPVGSTVYLLADREDTDRFGRFLRYLWKSNGEFFNEKAARLGYAEALLIQPNDRFIDVIRAAEADERVAGRGMWSACQVVNQPPPPSAPEPVPAPPPPPATWDCHASYPDFCIQPPPPDLDCADVSGRRFRVLPPDPHGFDGDCDQVGCESG